MDEFRSSCTNIYWKIKQPSYATVVEWVRKSRDVDISIIQRSFKFRRISTARDGSEDNLIFDYDSLINKKKKIEK
jgi:hypothetical protein